MLLWGVEILFEYLHIFLNKIGWADVVDEPGISSELMKMNMLKALIEKT